MRSFAIIFLAALFGGSHGTNLKDDERMGDTMENKPPSSMPDEQANRIDEKPVSKWERHEIESYHPSAIKFRSIDTTAEPKSFSRQGELAKALKQKTTFRIVETEYNDLQSVDGKGRMSTAAYAKDPTGFDVVIKDVNVRNAGHDNYVNERKALLKLGRLVQYDDENLLLVTPRIFGVTLKSLLKSKEVGPEDYEALLGNCLEAVEEFSKLGIVQHDLSNPDNIIIEEDTNICRAIDFGLSAISGRYCDQKPEFTSAFHSWWDFYRIRRPYYLVEKYRFIPKTDIRMPSNLYSFVLNGNHMERDEKVESTIYVCNNLKHQPMQNFVFKDGTTQTREFPNFENTVGIFTALGVVIAAEPGNGDGLVLTHQIQGVPLSTFINDESQAKKIWTDTIKRYHDANILVGHISSSNIIVDEQGKGYIKNPSYSIVLDYKYVYIDKKYVQEKFNLEMEFLEYLQVNCPIFRESEKRICNYRPFVSDSVVVISNTLDEVIDQAIGRLKHFFRAIREFRRELQYIWS